MNSRERILAALSLRQPDRVPIFELYINEPNIVDLARILKPEAVGVKAEKERFGEERDEILDLYALVVEELGLDATCSNFSIGMEPLSEGRCRDKFGTVYQLSEHGEPLPIEGPIENRSDLVGFDMASRVERSDFAGVQHLIEKVGREKAHFVCVTDPFKASWRRRGGMQHLLMDYALDPGMAHGLARIATDFGMAAISMAVEVGADVIILPGDLAGEESTIISPRHYREYLKPYHRELVAHAHREGAKIVKHSDGNIWALLDDFIEAGFDGIHPFQPQCMELAQVKAHLTGKTCILGNIDCRTLLPYGTVAEVERAVRETIGKAAGGGGYIISSSNSIHPACKSENYIAMVRAAQRYGVYEK
ncbi:MAG: uroporphyrinogen decarboxylase family protein [Candidatus Latescibacterota bacterium]